jgi:hypothetical protein
MKNRSGALRAPPRPVALPPDSGKQSSLRARRKEEPFPTFIPSLRLWCKADEKKNSFKFFFNFFLLAKIYKQRKI